MPAGTTRNVTAQVTEEDIKAGEPFAADPAPGLRHRQAAAFGRAARRAVRPRLARRPGSRRPAGQGPGGRPATGNTPAGPAGKERR